MHPHAHDQRLDADRRALVCALVLIVGLMAVEVVAAQVNGITLLVVGVLIVYSAIRRLVDPPDVRGGIVLLVALGGVVVNVAAVALLSRASRESLNVRGA